MDFNYIMRPKQVVDSEFFYKTKGGSEKPEKKEEIILYLAKTKENLDNLTEAIKASDLPLEIRNSDSLAFARFNLSKAHWPEELKTGEKWAKVIKKASPKLYNEYIEFMSKVSK